MAPMPDAAAGSRGPRARDGRGPVVPGRSAGARRRWAAGTDAPEKTEVKIGFIPLTDCASVVMASALGLDKKHGVTITLSKEASWAGVRTSS